MEKSNVPETLYPGIALITRSSLADGSKPTGAQTEFTKCPYWVRCSGNVNKPVMCGELGKSGHAMTFRQPTFDPCAGD